MPKNTLGRQIFLNKLIQKANVDPQNLKHNKKGKPVLNYKCHRILFNKILSSQCLQNLGGFIFRSRYFRAPAKRYRHFKNDTKV